MIWIKITDPAEISDDVFLLCGVDKQGHKAMDFGFWQGSSWHLSASDFEPVYYAIVKWPSEYRKPDMTV